MNAIRYQLCLADTPMAPWRDSYMEALQDAVELGHAEYDQQYSNIFLTVPARIVRLTTK